MKNIIVVLIFILTGALASIMPVLVTAESSYSLKLKEQRVESDPCDVEGACPYKAWQVGCDGYGVKGPASMASEAWYVQLQNGKSLGTTSVRCWCDNTNNPYANDDIVNGTTHWTFIGYMVWDGQTCTCQKGETAWAELDPDTCATGMERATGFFYEK